MRFTFRTEHYIGSVALLLECFVSDDTLASDGFLIGSRRPIRPVFAIRKPACNLQSIVSTFARDRHDIILVVSAQRLRLAELSVCLVAFGEEARVGIETSNVMLRFPRIHGVELPRDG
jgi:hypothetical protein